MHRLFYLPSRTTGYALAILAWLRGESKPAWARFLRQDAADAFHGGLYYLDRTDDSLVRPDNLRNHNRNPSLRKLLAQLEDGSGSEAVVALWELARRGPAAGEAAEAVAYCLTDQRPAIRPRPRERWPNSARRPKRRFRCLAMPWKTARPRSVRLPATPWDNFMPSLTWLSPD